MFSSRSSGGWTARLLSFAGGAIRVPLARCRSVVRAVAALEAEVAAAGDEALLERSLSLCFRAKTGENNVRLMPEAFALVREAARRTLGMRHFDVQILGGAALAFGAIAEMETGEGKTLTATLPLYLQALAGKGAHLATANDYLARRDADLMRPIFESLGMTVGAIDANSSPAERRAAYACDITYGTAAEFGFDLLRDRLAQRAAEDQSPTGGMRSLSHPLMLQRAPHFLLVDEADSVLIDDARTPLVIGLSTANETGGAAERFRWCRAAAQSLREGVHFETDSESCQSWLTPAGRDQVRSREMPPAFAGLKLPEIYEAVERAIYVEHHLHRDRHYVVRNGGIVPVEESTGRLAEGRKWRRGVHQAIEAREGLDITFATAHAARISIQELCRRYPHLAGMTGTARSAASEFRRIYGRPVVAVPTHRPIQRIVLPARVFSTAEAKWTAVVDEVRAVHASGRPVLIGTRSIDRSEELSRRLSAAGLAHAVLNAHQSKHEADIIARAGEADCITVATNMAGRGTDIRLGPGVAERGGLHVIGTELHESARIDRQLEGRCARQGDPGSFRQFLSLEDDILQDAYGPREAALLRDELIRTNAGERRWLQVLRRAQVAIERRHAAARKLLFALEAERRQMAEELGQDPCLDLPED